MKSIKHSAKRNKKLSVTAKTKAICFDLDGVLVPAPQWHREAFDRALEFYGYRPLTDKEHEETYNGLSTKKKLEMLDREGLVKASMAQLIHEKKQEFTVQLINEKCRPIERVRDLVFWLFNNGYKTGVVTNCSRHTTHLMLKLSGLIGCWYTCITNEDVDGFIKPHPAPYIAAVRELCGFPDFAMAIDDTHHGIQSAREAGVGRIWHLENFSDLTLKNLKSRL